MGFKVFLSYSTRDLTLVDQLQYWLEQHGVETYLAELYPTLGYTVSDKIADTIRISDCILGILTTDGLRSDAVHLELGMAQQSGKLVIALVEQGVVLPHGLMDVGVIYFDRLNPVHAINEVVPYLRRQRLTKENSQKAVAAAILAIGLFALAAADRSKV